MSEKEKEIIRKVAQALPDMSDMNKGYFLGFAEAMASQKNQKKEEEKEEEENVLEWQSGDTGSGFRSRSRKTYRKDV